jgi:hypothetical protein
LALIPTIWCSGLSFRVLLQKALAREKEQATEQAIQMEWAAGVEMPAEWVMAGVPVEWVMAVVQVEWAAVLEAQADRAMEEAVIKTILDK